MPLATSSAQRMLELGIPIGEKVVRTLAVYLVVFVLLRLFGKRDLAQLNAFDLIVLLLLSNVVQNAIIGPDDSLVGGAIGAATLVVANAALVRLVKRSDRLDEAFEGRKVVLASGGRLNDPVLHRYGIRAADVEVVMRRQGAARREDVERAELYPNGAIVVDLRDGARAATRGDVQRLEAKVAALTAKLDRLLTDE